MRRASGRFRKKMLHGIRTLLILKGEFFPSVFARGVIVFIMIAIANWSMVNVSFAQFAKFFSDVPKEHWAHDSVLRVVRAGLISIGGEKYYGKRLLNRYQMAQLISRFLYILNERQSRAAAESTDLNDRLYSIRKNLESHISCAKKLNSRLAVLEDQVGDCKIPLASMLQK